MRKFKVGDKVLGVHGDIEGCEGIIMEVLEDRYKIKLTSVGKELWHGDDEWQIGNIINRQTFWEDCLKLIKPHYKQGNKLEKETKEIARRIGCELPF